MAGDWMKIELELPDKPEIFYMAGALGIDSDAVVGKLLRVWGWFDKHTEDGNASNVTFALIDRITNVVGFAEAMSLAGWLTQEGHTLTLPNFDRHNGKTAKKRALTAKRVNEYKEKSNATTNAPSVTFALPREEKRREDNKRNRSNDFDRFWKIYPKKVKKKTAHEIWKRKKLDFCETDLVQDVENRIKNCGRWKGGFTPDPTTYLNQERWNDELDTKAKPTQQKLTGNALVSACQAKGITTAGKTEWQLQAELEAK